LGAFFRRRFVVTDLESGSVAIEISACSPRSHDDNDRDQAAPRDLSHAVAAAFPSAAIGRYPALRVVLPRQTPSKVHAKKRKTVVSNR